MQDELQSAYDAYQNALFHLPSPKEDAKLWYGIGILYDRYGSLQHAEEAFASVLKMDQSECTHSLLATATHRHRLSQILKRRMRSTFVSASYTNNSSDIPNLSRYSHRPLFFSCERNQCNTLN